MKREVISFFMLLALLPAMALVGCASNAVVSEQANASEEALTHILFDYNADQFTAYQIRRNGFVDITFARDVPDGLYNEMLGKLREHPDIPGVVSGKTGQACGLF